MNKIFLMMGLVTLVGCNQQQAPEKTSNEKAAETTTSQEKPVVEEKTDVDKIEEKKEIFIPRSIAGDKGKYYLIEMKKEGNIIYALSKRVGVDTVGYTETETNCATQKMREIGYGEEAISNITKTNSATWFDLEPGSSKSDLAHFVCSK